jgi:Fic family protein
MNDTITSPRQQLVLNLINESNGRSRETLQALIANRYKVSKPTLIRDLNQLVKLGLIKTKGEARATIYYPKIVNPLFRPFDLTQYFAQELDERTHTKKRFDYGIFDYLHDLFTPEEQMVLNREARDFRLVTEQLAPSYLKRELERFVIELSWKSSRIEGNTYTLLETETLIKEQTEAKGHTREEAQMILNHKTVFDSILNNQQEYQKLSLTQITQMHGALVIGLPVITGIRRYAVGITGTTYLPLDNEHQLREALDKTIDTINQATNPFEKALIAHFMFAYLQTFADGNKRLARMLTNAILLAHNLFPLSYRSVNIEIFKQALILFYEQSSVVAIKNIFIDQFKFANRTYFPEKQTFSE